VAEDYAVLRMQHDRAVIHGAAWLPGA